jgi:hypothetical protein
MNKLTRRGFVKGAAIAPLAAKHLALGAQSVSARDTTVWSRQLIFQKPAFVV